MTTVYVADVVPSGPQVSVSLSDAVYTPVLPKGTTSILAQAQDQDIYYTLGSVDPNPDGTPPVGFLLTKGSPVERIPVHDVSDPPRFYRTASGAIFQFQPARYSYVR